MLEILVSIVIGERRRSRTRVAWLGGLAIFLVGIPSALSFGIWSDVKIFGQTVFDFVDFLTNNIGMPIGALLIALFAGYYYSKETSQYELDVSPRWYHTWRFLIRYVVPVAIIVIFIQGIQPIFT